MTEIKYRTLDSTDAADIQDGDRVTFMRPFGNYPEDEYRGIARLEGCIIQAAGWIVVDSTGLDKGVTIVKIERPITPIPTKLGAVALPKDSPLAPLARIGCERWPWRNMDGEGFTDAAVQGRVDAGTHYIAFEGVEA